MNKITEPLRLAVGSHRRGSGKGCAMNVISWESGDTTITDLPACADVVLAHVVQRANDRLCTHRDGDLLCPGCSTLMLDLAHRTVGTGTGTLTLLERRVVWVRIAADQARQVLHLATPAGRPLARAAIEAAERWAADPAAPLPPCPPYDAIASANASAYAIAAAIAANAAANAAAYAIAAAIAADAAAADAADAAKAAGSGGVGAVYDADTAAAAAAAAAANAAGSVANAASGAAIAAGSAASANASANASAYAADTRLSLAHRAVDLFERLTGHVPPPPSAERLRAAVADMCVTVTS